LVSKWRGRGRFAESAATTFFRAAGRFAEDDEHLRTTIHRFSNRQPKYRVKLEIIWTYKLEKKKTAEISS
jgi:hypothetical protein